MYSDGQLVIGMTVAMVDVIIAHAKVILYNDMG
jgi:hypothetical protein